MPVYMIQAGSPTGPVKIGHGDVQERLVGLQIGNHLELRIIRLFVGGLPEESMLHVRFLDVWIRGEWHNFSRPMLGDVGLVEIEIPRIELPAPPTSIHEGGVVDGVTLGPRIRSLRKSRGLTQTELAGILNIARSTLAGIEVANDLPGRDTLLRITRFFGVPFETIDEPV